MFAAIYLAYPFDMYIFMPKILNEIFEFIHYCVIFYKMEGYFACIFPVEVGTVASCTQVKAYLLLDNCDLSVSEKSLPK